MAEFALIPMLKKALAAPDLAFLKNMHNPTFALVVLWCMMLSRRKALEPEEQELITDFLDRVESTLLEGISEWRLKKQMLVLGNNLSRRTRTNRGGSTGVGTDSGLDPMLSTAARSTAQKRLREKSSKPPSGQSAESTGTPSPRGDSSSSPASSSATSSGIPMPPTTVATGRQRDGHWSDCNFRKDPERLCNCEELDDKP